jgi:hypothetical protein
MRRRAWGAGSPPLPDTLSLVALLLLVLLLLLAAAEPGTGSCSCRALKADAVVPAAAAARKHRSTVLRTGTPPAASATGEAGGAAYDESKRMVPQGPNPLHN